MYWKPISKNLKKLKKLSSKASLVSSIQNFASQVTEWIFNRTKAMADLLFPLFDAPEIGILKMGFVVSCHK